MSFVFATMSDLSVMDLANTSIYLVSYKLCDMLCINAVTSHELQCYNMSLTMMASNNHHLDSLYTQDIPSSLASQPASQIKCVSNRTWEVLAGEFDSLRIFPYSHLFYLPQNPKPMWVLMCAHK